eukprot:TRINITY_DN13_c0_g1_i4.p1 TRINITY_DN13_c0_g1~~TRINITY_DN13_c0_g1_i4.p1  ORF type:complete len:399 (-),score=37.90 TRINITY_DN13_c0_g1_i4:39-1235(-)
MTRLWIFLVVALVSMHLAEGSRRRRRGYYNDYKRGGMGYPKRSNYGLDLRKVAPRCSYKMTWVRIVVEGPKGGGYPNALISLQDEKQMGKLYTDRNGVAKAAVKGCKISLIVWGKDLQTTYELVSLKHNKSGKETIYVKVKSRCNFLLHLDQRNDGPVSENDFDEDTYIQYQYVAKSGGYKEAGNGIAVSGSENPICINWKPFADGEKGSLKVQAVSQSTADTNVLHITKQGDDKIAVLNIPSYIDDSYKFLICINVWAAGDDDLISIDSGFLNAFNSMGSVDLSNSVDDDGSCAWFKDLDAFADGENTLLTVDFSAYDEGDGETLEGNAYIQDCNGKYTTVEVTGDETYTEGFLWPFACICDGAKDIRGVKVLKNQDFSDSIYDNSLCDDVCTQNSK